MLMKILIGCEYSGEVREAFRAKGHDAWSCDLLPSDDDSPYHIQGDVIEAIRSEDWDFIGLHPPCTALCVSGNRTYGFQKEKHRERLEAMVWTLDLWCEATDKCDKVYLENPVGVLSRVMDIPQYIQPYQFGHTETKKTGLWLHGLEPLKETNNVYDDMMTLPKKDRHKIHYASPSPDRWKIRSKTFPGIARAMADQWGEL
jgi:hypothetical protein